MCRRPTSRWNPIRAILGSGRSLAPSSIICGEQADPRPPAVPRNFGLPFLLGSRRRVKPGPFGGFLGGAYDTIWSEFRAKGTREVLRDAGAPDVPTRMVADPYLGILPTDRFESVASDETITLDRLNGRGSLLDQLDSARRALDRNAAETSFNGTARWPARC